MESDKENYFNVIPDECLAIIFQFLGSNDRKNCSLVCRRWYAVESISRHQLTVDVSVGLGADVTPHIPAIFSRYPSVTDLYLRSRRESQRVSDVTLIRIAARCRNITRLKVRRCHGVTGLGLAALARGCERLREFSCDIVTFGSRGMNAFLNHCSSLEKLTVRSLCGTNLSDGGVVPELVGAGTAASSLKSVSLKYLYYGERFALLIAESENLKTLKILRCFGPWDTCLETITNLNKSLVSIHLESLQVTNVGLAAVSKCPNLETLHLRMTPDWEMPVGEEGLIAIAKNSKNLKELVLDGMVTSITSLSAIASGCVKLERLVLAHSERIGDPEVCCIAKKCVGLKKLCINGCLRVSDEGIEAFGSGCPNLVELSMKNCRDVSGEVADWLIERRPSLAVKLDIEADEIGNEEEWDWVFSD
nr:F-box protein At1g47056-like [Ipomoea batatas]